MTPHKEILATRAKRAEEYLWNRNLCLVDGSLEGAYTSGEASMDAEVLARDAEIERLRDALEGLLEETDEMDQSRVRIVAAKAAIARCTEGLREFTMSFHAQASDQET